MKIFRKELKRRKLLMGVFAAAVAGTASLLSLNLMGASASEGSEQYRFWYEDQVGWTLDVLANYDGEEEVEGGICDDAGECMSVFHLDEMQYRNDGEEKPGREAFEKWVGGYDPLLRKLSLKADAQIAHLQLVSDVDFAGQGQAKENYTWLELNGDYAVGIFELRDEPYVVFSGEGSLTFPYDNLPTDAPLQYIATHFEGASYSIEGDKVTLTVAGDREMGGALRLRYGGAGGRIRLYAVND